MKGKTMLNDNNLDKMMGEVVTLVAAMSRDQKDALARGYYDRAEMYLRMAREQFQLAEAIRKEIGATVYTVADMDGQATAGPMSLEEARDLKKKQRKNPAKAWFVWRCTLSAERHLTPINIVRDTEK